MPKEPSPMTPKQLNCLCEIAKKRVTGNQVPETWVLEYLGAKTVAEITKERASKAIKELLSKAA